VRISEGHRTLRVCHSRYCRGRRVRGTGPRRSTTSASMWSNLPTGIAAAIFRKLSITTGRRLQCGTSASHPVDWAWTQHNLGLAGATYRRATGVATFTKPSIATKAALTVRTPTLTQWTGLGHSTISLSLGVTCRQETRSTTCREPSAIASSAHGARARHAPGRLGPHAERPWSHMEQHACG